MRPNKKPHFDYQRRNHFRFKNQHWHFVVEMRK
jgi:hypothetical protein